MHPLKLTIMKALIPFKHYFFMISTFLLFLTSSCTKSNIETPDPIPNDPGFGCNTSVVMGTLSNAAGKLFYNSAKNEWWIRFSTPGFSNFTIICNQSSVDTIITGHTVLEEFIVTVSGTIKAIDAFQASRPFPTPPESYPIPYLINITHITK